MHPLHRLFITGVFCAFASFPASAGTQTPQSLSPSAPSTTIVQPIVEISVGQKIGQCRAAPVKLGAGQPIAFFASFSADFDIDPWTEMFFFPTDTLKLAVYTTDGRELWRRDLGPGVMPGLWFTPFLPADLDGDGVDEIYFVGNTNPQHPLSYRSKVLERVDALTGKTTGQWPWPHDLEAAALGKANRNFLLAGTVQGKTVLVTAQGTYGAMYLQAWNTDMTPRWSISYSENASGPRGSHMTPVVDWDGDGNDEFFWGERLIRFENGVEVFCADHDTWYGHSDIIQPVLDDATGTWSFYTCRESAYPKVTPQGTLPIAPRVCYYDSAGRRLWGNLETGHMDQGFIARVGSDRMPLASAIRVEGKKAGAEGRSHQSVEGFFYDSRTGKRLDIAWSAYRTLPVDLDGDGRHEFVRGSPSGDGALWDLAGRSLGSVGGPVALLCKLTPHAGEQLLSYHPEGKLRLWANPTGQDSAAACARYANPFYQANRRHTATGYNLSVLGGL